jgi:hypothetical protein
LPLQNLQWKRRLQWSQKYLEDISKKGTYGSRKNEFYYALGLMPIKQEKQMKQEFFRKSLKEKVSDPQIRGLAYYEIGKGYLIKTIISEREFIMILHCCNDL